jgi:uncharacterized protein YndB with AHSA1/START domain
MPDPRKTKAAGIGDEAVQAKTGKTWPEWFAILDKAGAAEWPHKKIAIFLHDECSCPDWWSQMVTVGFEQARGLRVKHQTASGFSANSSKTISVAVSILYGAWTDPKKLAKWLPDGKKMTIRKATENKSVRATWIDGTSNLDIQFWIKGDAKTQVTVEHSKLGSLTEVERSKAHWGEALLRLKTLLEGADGKESDAKAKRPAVAKKKPSR